MGAPPLQPPRHNAMDIIREGASPALVQWLNQHGGTWTVKCAIAAEEAVSVHPLYDLGTEPSPAGIFAALTHPAEGRYPSGKLNPAVQGENLPAGRYGISGPVSMVLRGILLTGTARLTFDDLTLRTITGGVVNLCSDGGLDEHGGCYWMKSEWTKGELAKKKRGPTDPLLWEGGYKLALTLLPDDFFTGRMFKDVRVELSPRTIEYYQRHPHTEVVRVFPGRERLEGLGERHLILARRADIHGEAGWRVDPHDELAKYARRVYRGEEPEAREEDFPGEPEVWWGYHGFSPVRMPHSIGEPSPEYAVLKNSVLDYPNKRTWAYGNLHRLGIEVDYEGVLTGSGDREERAAVHAEALRQTRPDGWALILTERLKFGIPRLALYRKRPADAYTGFNQERGEALLEVDLLAEHVYDSELKEQYELGTIPLSVHIPLLARDEWDDQIRARREAQGDREAREAVRAAVEQMHADLKEHHAVPLGSGALGTMVSGGRPKWCLVGRISRYDGGQPLLGPCEIYHGLGTSHKVYSWDLTQRMSLSAQVKAVPRAKLVAYLEEHVGDEGPADFLAWKSRLLNVYRDGTEGEGNTQLHDLPIYEKR